MLPEKLREEIFQYRKNDDRIRLLAGKLLLLKAIHKLEFNHKILEQYIPDTMGKPQLPSFFPFNITHSGHVVACAVLQGNGLIGIDCEKIRPIDVIKFTKQFSPQEMQWILSAPDPQERFFDAWTMKEAVMKADGRGMRIPLHSIRLQQTYATIDDRKGFWYLYKLPTPPSHPSHICSPEKIQSIETIEVNATELFKT
ncbi:MAG: 4'-phosphopantetheinyl transferase superfamily protein [Flavobacteriales bacterium]|nr:4'-phosphopantetheinyl transferase superfamily protein [Flavobacteriales bacterium]